eukprot:2507811-Pleurochrysis_carterae.AAC.1
MTSVVRMSASRAPGRVVWVRNRIRTRRRAGATCQHGFMRRTRPCVRTHKTFRQHKEKQPKREQAAFNLSMKLRSMGKGWLGFGWRG